MAAEVGIMNSELFLKDLQLEVTGTIMVMLCRMWDVNAVTGRYLSTDFLVSDAKGGVVHCTAKGTVAHNFLRLKEGSVYSIKNFIVMQNREDFRIRKDDTLMLQFDGATTVRKAVVKREGFVRYPFQLVDLDHIVPTDNKYLIDVVGYVTNVGRMNYTKTGSKNLYFYLANHRGQSIRVTLWGGLGDILIEKIAKYAGLLPVVVTCTSAKHYNNKLYLSSSSSTMILDDVEIPAIKELRSGNSIIEASRVTSRADNSEPREGTIENLLIWSRNRKNDSATFICKARIENVRAGKGWNYPSCGGEKCKKGITRKEGRFWCDGCDKPVEYPVLRYHLELGISDDTEQTVVVLFDDPATELVKFPAAAIVDEDNESFEENENLPSAIANLIGTTHVFEIKSHSYYEYGIFESFTCWTVDPRQPTVETGSSSTVDDGAVAGESSSNPHPKAPSVATPAKSTENKKKKKLEIEDSDTETEMIPADDVQGETNALPANKKPKRFVVTDSE